MVGLLVGGGLLQFPRDDAAECQEGLMGVGLGECLPEVRQEEVRWLQWARGGTERDPRCRMMILPGGRVSGERGSTPPASGAPVRRLWATPPRDDKAELRVECVCLFVIQHAR